MRVLVLTTSYPRYEGDDAGIFVERLVEAFSEIGLNGKVAVPYDQKSQTNVTGNFGIKRVGYTLFSEPRLAFGAGIIPNIKRNPLSVLQAPGLLIAFFREIIRFRKEVDILHANWIVTALPVFIGSLITRIPYVITVRGEDARLIRNSFIRTLLYLVLKKASRIVVVSENLKEDLLKSLPRLSSRLVVIENGVKPMMVSDAEKLTLRNALKIEAGDKILLFVGSVIPRKRIEDLITIMKLSKNRSLKLLIVGRVTDEEYVTKIRKQIADDNLESQVLLCGAVDPVEVWRYYAIADLVVSASSFEGRPNSIVEALAVGCRVLLSDIPAHRELHEKSAAVHIFKHLEDGKNELEALLKEESRKAPDIAHFYSWSESAEAYKKIFNEALSPRFL